MRSIRFATRHCWAVVLLCSGATVSLGSEPGVAAPSATSALTLTDAIVRALANNPDLAQFSFSLKAQDARMQQAAARPATELSVELEDAFGTGRTRYLDSAQATIALSQIIELGGARERRIDSARAATDVISVERSAAQLDVLAEVTRRLIHVASDQEQLGLTRRATTLAQDTVAEVRRRVRAAKSPEVELNRAQIALIRAGIEEEHAEHELLTSRRKLTAMWGGRDPDFKVVNADLFALPRVRDFDTLVERLAGNPDLLKFATQARLRDAELRLAQAKARPHVALSAGVRRIQDGNDTAFVMGVTMPLLSARRAESGIAEARAMLDRVEVDAAAAQIKAEVALFELAQELRHAIAEATTLRDEVLPQIESALQQTEYAYQRGRYSYIEWVDTQRELFDVHRALIEAAANAHIYSTEIERLTGEPLGAETTNANANR